MKTTIIAAVAALSLGAGAAYAAGGPVGYETPAYGAQAFVDHSHDAQVHFLGQGTVLGKMFNYSTNHNRVAATAAPKG